MCGIISYIGNKQALPILLEGLKTLEYRGYDSAGVSLICDKQLQTQKVSGKIAVLESKLQSQCFESHIGIAHTRWATHGSPVEANAHPHNSFDNKISVVHNGIIENYAALKAKLESQGIVFNSETDTEVISHLIALFYKGDIKSAVFQAISKPVRHAFFVNC